MSSSKIHKISVILASQKKPILSFLLILPSALCLLLLLPPVWHNTLIFLPPRVSCVRGELRIPELILTNINFRAHTQSVSWKSEWRVHMVEPPLCVDKSQSLYIEYMQSGNFCFLMRCNKWENLSVRHIAAWVNKNARACCKWSVTDAYSTCTSRLVLVHVMRLFHTPELVLGPAWLVVRFTASPHLVLHSCPPRWGSGDQIIIIKICIHTHIHQVTDIKDQSQTTDSGTVTLLRPLRLQRAHFNSLEVVFSSLFVWLFAGLCKN